MGYLGIGLVLVLGIAVVVYGWLADRVDTKRRRDALTSVPDRPIPGLPDDAPSPDYRTEDELLYGSDAVSRDSVSAESVAAIVARLSGAPTLGFGHASADFANTGGFVKLSQREEGLSQREEGLSQREGGLSQREGGLSQREDVISHGADSGPGPSIGSRSLRKSDGDLCVLQTPRILVTDCAVMSIREVFDFLAKAGADRVPVVIVAPQMAADVLATLRVNSVHGNVPGAVVLAPDATRRAQLASLVGATPVGLDDLRAGYLPASVLGGCDVWVSSLQRVWVVNS